MLAILTTHPIQYQVPIWQELARRGNVPFEVWYLADHGYRKGFDKGFGKAFSWDLNMLAGYPYRFLSTRPPEANINKFWGARLGSLASLFHEQRVTAMLINGWSPLAYWQAAFQANRAGIPVLLRAETNDIRKLPWWKERVKRALLGVLFQRISVFLTVGIANRRFYRKYGVPEDRLGSAPYCVDNRRFSEAAEGFRPQRFILRKTWGIPLDSTCFLFSGKLIAKKRPQDLLCAFEMLFVKRKEFGLKHNIHLLIVGGGALWKVLEEKAKELNNTAGKSCVTLAGFLNQTEIPKAYAVADCLVLPSDAGETWGLVVNEAMACGLPAIVSDQVGCGADLIEPGITGDLFPVADVEALAATIAAWSDPVRCRSAREAVLENINNFSIESAVDGTLEGLQTVCPRPHPSAHLPGTPVLLRERDG